jgi:hypothetical protein
MIDVLTECRHPTAWSPEEIMELYRADFAKRLVSGISDAIVYEDAEGAIRVSRLESYFEIAAVATQ